MNALSKLRRYLLDFRRQHNDTPKSIPVSRAEAIEVMNDSGPFVQDIALTPSSPQIFGLDMEEHDFAPMIRERRLRIPICDFMQEYPVNAAMRHNVEFIAREGVAQIRAHILADKTRVRVTSGLGHFRPRQEMVPDQTEAENGRDRLHRALPTLQGSTASQPPPHALQLASTLLTVTLMKLILCVAAVWAGIALAIVILFFTSVARAARRVYR